MEKFVVPQFIENEDKIVAFLSVRQFLIVLGTFGLIAICYKTMTTIPFVLSALVIGASGMVIAFYKVNGQPFHLFLINVIQTNRRPMLRVWKKEVSQKEWEAEERAAMEQHEREIREYEASRAPIRHEPSARRLSDLSLIVDTGGAYQGDVSGDKELF